MNKRFWTAVAVLSALFALSGCVTLQETYQKRVEKAADQPMFAAFHPNPFGEKSPHSISVYDESLRIVTGFGIVDLVGEGEKRYRTRIDGSDPVLDRYLGVASKRGNIVKQYKGILNERMFKLPGVTDFWKPRDLRLNTEDSAYLEFDTTGRMKSALIRRGILEKSGLGIFVQRENVILSGSFLRSIENRISNREMDDAFLRDVRQ